MNAHETARYTGEPTALLDEQAARAELGGISHATLWRIRRRGELASVRIGRRLFFRPADLDAYIERHRETVGAP
jgi:Helix-turn-helix domain